MKKNLLFSAARSILGILLIFMVAAFFGVPPAQAGSGAQRSKNLSTPELISQALDAGQIDSDTANLFRAYAFGDYGKLPQAYRSNAPWDGTLTLWKLRRALNIGSVGRYRSEIASLLAPGGACGSSSTALPNVINSTYFHIEYGTIGGGLNISNYTTSLDSAWTKEVVTFGWAAPPVLTSNPPPGNLYHVRIDNLGGGLYGFVTVSGAHADFVGDNPNTAWNDLDAFATCMVLNNDYSGFPSTPQQSLDATTAHEFNHSIQFGYGVFLDLNFDTPADIYIEGGATWMEDEIYDSANDNYNYLWPDFHVSMGGYPNGFAYPYWITWRGLTERYGTGSAGGGEQVMEDFWEILSQTDSDNEIAALNTALGNRGTNLNDAFHAYAIAVKFNQTCGGNFVLPYCFEEAAGYVSAAGATTVHGSIGSVGGSFSGSIADSYAINWISLPSSSSIYPITLQNTSAGGSLRASVVCSTASALTITAFPSVLGAGASASVNTFNPSGCSSRAVVITNQSTATAGTARSYTLSTCTPNINVTIAGTPRGGYCVSAGGSQRDTYALDDGPVKIASTGVNIIAALRDAWLVNGQVTSFAQLMGLPNAQLSDTYHFPAYNNVTLSEQIRIGNVDTVATDVTVRIGGQLQNNGNAYHLLPNQGIRLTYNLDSGPVEVKSTGQKIIAAIRSAWLVNGQVTSFTQLMGLPKESLSDTYYLPAYNNVTLSGQLRIGNVDTVATDVLVTIAGVPQNNGNTYHLESNQSVRVTYPLDAGPVEVKGTTGVKIIAALRDAWLVNGQVKSFAQLMGLPKEKLSDTYLFPAYNNLTLSGQLRIANVGASATTVTVKIGGATQGTYPLNQNESVRPTYALDNGPVEIKSSGGVKIIAALRDAWLTNGQVTSFVQMMGLPQEALSTTYWLPAYNNITLSGQLRFGVP